MTSGSLVRVLLVRWHITAAGLLLSLVLAAMAYILVPLQYASSGTAVLVQAKRPGSSSANPLLTFDPSLNTTASILVQSLSAPQVFTELRLTTGRDKITVKNEGSTAVGDGGSGEPFISVTAQSSDPEKSAAIVAWVLDRGRQELIDRQNSMRVATRNAIRLETVVDVAPPKPARESQLRALGVAVLVGIVITITAARTCDRIATRRTRRSSTAEPRASEDVELAADAWPAAIDTTRVPKGVLMRAAAVPESPSANG